MSRGALLCPLSFFVVGDVTKSREVSLKTRILIYLASRCKLSPKTTSMRFKRESCGMTCPNQATGHTSTHHTPRQRIRTPPRVTSSPRSRPTRAARPAIKLRICIGTFASFWSSVAALGQAAVMLCGTRLIDRLIDKQIAPSTKSLEMT